MGTRAGATGDERGRGALTLALGRLGAGGGAMVGVARSGREPGAGAGARQRDTRAGRGAGTCLQPGLTTRHTHSPLSCEKSKHLRNEELAFFKVVPHNWTLTFTCCPRVVR